MNFARTVQNVIESLRRGGGLICGVALIETVAKKNPGLEKMLNGICTIW